MPKNRYLSFPIWIVSPSITSIFFSLANEIVNNKKKKEKKKLIFFFVEYFESCHELQYLIDLAVYS